MGQIYEDVSGGNHYICFHSEKQKSDKNFCRPQNEDIAMADRGTWLLRFAVGAHWSQVKLLAVVLTGGFCPQPSSQSQWRRHCVLVRSPDSRVTPLHPRLPRCVLSPSLQLPCISQKATMPWRGLPVGK